MLYEQAAFERMPHRGKRHRDREKTRRDDRELNGRLPRCAAKLAYRPLMPWAIASHSPCSLGRNTTIASIAITTSTPTKIAYSVVPWPFVTAMSACTCIVAAALALEIEPDILDKIRMMPFLSSR